MNKYLRISELEELTGISNSTCRRYIREYKDFFVSKGDRVKQYDSQAVDILKRIRQLTNDGMGKDEIHNTLMNEFPIVVNDEEDKKEDQQVTGLATIEDITDVMDKLEKQEEFNKVLVQKLDEQSKLIQDQQQYIEKQMSKRDELLMKAIDERLEAQKQIAIAEEPEKKGFWSRLFRK